MQPLRVVHVTDESAEVLLGVSERLVVVQVHLLALERLGRTLIGDRRLGGTLPG